MSKIVFLFSFLLLFVKCTTQSVEKEKFKNDTSKIERTVFGTYEGKIPCADCEGVLENLELKNNYTFILKSTYKGRAEETSFVEQGKYVVDSGKIVLFPDDSTVDYPKYLIVNHSLEKLDMNGERIKSVLNYKLRKR
jgi:uncharacterized lipoprotein NlpE involved in copper resistance